MEQILIEQFLNNNISLKKIQIVVDNFNKINTQQHLNETTTANTSGLRIMSCQGCHKSMFEDKFMLHRTSKRYRSCINCVTRARNARGNKKPKQHNIDNKDLILAVCDQIDSEIYNIEPIINVTDSVNIETKRKSQSL